jgi:hypothetical protein
MKKIFTLLAAIVLVLSASAVWAVPTIIIDGTLEAAPIVTTSGFSPLSGRENLGVVTAYEFAGISGILTADFLTPGLYGAAMMENPADPDYPASSYRGVSDLAVLLVFPAF